MSAGLFTVVQLDESDVVRIAAGGVETAAAELHHGMRAATQSWSPLEQEYSAPEAPALHSALTTPVSVSQELADAGTRVYGALSRYAERLAELATTRAQLLNDIGSFETDGVQGADDDDRSAREEAIEGLKARCQALAEAKDEAQNTCAAELGAITTSSANGRGSLRVVPSSNEGSDVAQGTPYTDYVETLAGSRAEWGGLNLDSGAEQLGYGLTGAAFIVDSARGLMVRGAVRHGWPPNFIQSMSKGSAIGEKLVRAGLGWSHQDVKNPGQFIAKDGALSPFRRPVGVRDSARVMLGRVSAASRTKMVTVPRPGSAAPYATWGRIGNVVSRVAAPVGVASTAASSWSEDSLAHPDMGVAEKSSRAAVSAGTALVGAAAGAKAGAAMGAAVGSFFGPGPGTAVGAVIGGVVGGVAGSSLGQAIGDTVKEEVGKQAQAVADKFKSFFGG